MSTHIQQLYDIIMQYRLYQRHEYWADIRYMLEHSMIDDAMCRDILMAQAKPSVDYIKDIGLWLWRPPEVEELYAHGRPDIELGNLMEGAEKFRFGIRIADRPRNLLVIGSAGSGKTTTLRNICRGIHAFNQQHPDQFISMIIIDPKPDYLNLPQMLGDEWLVFSPNHNLRIGLNGPENVPHRVWLNAMTITLAARLGLIAARTTLARMIDWFITRLNPEPGQTLVYPSLQMILDACKQKRFLDCFSSKANYGQTLIQYLEGLLQDSGDLFDCCNGLNIQRDIIFKKKHGIINVSNLPAYITNILSDTVINWELVPRQHNQYKCDRTEVSYLLDESDLLIDERSEADFGNNMSPLSKLERLGREPGLHVNIGVSSIKHTVPHITINTPYIIAHNHSDADSVVAVRKALQIEPGCDRMITSLESGQCIFRQTQSPWTQAMWCDVDEIKPPRDNAAVEYKAHPFIPAKAMSDVKGLPEAMHAHVDKFQKTNKRSGSETAVDLQQTAMDVLKLSTELPYYPMARLFDRLKIKAYQVQEDIRSFLTDEALADIETASTGRTQRALIEPTETGYQRLGIEPPKGNKGRGNVTHRTFAHWIKMWAEDQGLEAAIEQVVPGSNHPADVAIETEDGRYDLYEIVVTAETNLDTHISACFEKSSAVASLTIVASTKTKAKQIRSQILKQHGDADYINNIQFESIETFMLKELKK